MHPGYERVRFVKWWKGKRPGDIAELPGGVANLLFRMGRAVYEKDVSPEYAAHHKHYETAESKPKRKRGRPKKT